MNVGESNLEGEVQATPPIDLSTIDDIVDTEEGGNAPNEWGNDVVESPEGGEIPNNPAASGEPVVPKTNFDPANDDLINPDGSEKKPEGEEGSEIIDENEDEVNLSPDEEFFSGVTKILKGKDFFQQDELGEIKTEKDFADALDKEIEARLSDRYKELDELSKSGAPVDHVMKLSQGLSQLEQITENTIQESPELSQQLIVEDFINKGFSQEDAVKYYELINQAGNSTAEAVKALGERKNQFANAIKDVKSKAAKEKQDVVDNDAAQLAKLEKAFEADKILGRSVGPATREKLKSLASTPVGYTKQGQPLNRLMQYKLDNPVDFEQKLSYLFLVTNDFKDLKSFDRSAETRVSRTLRSAVNVLSTDGGPTLRAQSAGKNVVDLDSIDDIV